MARSVGGEPPPPPDLSGFPSLNPRAAHLPAAAAPSPAGASMLDAAADLSIGRGSCAPTADAGSGDVKGAWKGERTLAQLLSRSLQPAAIPVRVHAPAATDLGKPAAFFSPEEVQVSCNPLDYVLMVKTPLGRPPFQIIRGHLSQRFNLEKDFILCPYDGRHLLLRMGSREDFLKLLLKGTTYVHGKPFRFQKWSMDFSVAADSPLVPVWLEMPRLPANFFLEPMLRSIAGSIGQVLQIAQCTLNLTMAHAAVVCVQLDVSQPLPDCVWIGIGAGGFWQPVVYPNPPQFCNSCNRLGHLAPNCRQAATPSAPQHKGTKVASDKGIQMPPHDAVGPERLQKQPPVNANWRPIVAQPAPAKRIPPVEQGTKNAQEVFDVMSQQELPSGSKASTVQAQAHGVYLTPPKRPQQKSTLGTSAKGSDPATSIGGESGAMPDLQQMRSQPSHDQVAASQVLDEMTHSVEQLSLQAKVTDPSVGISGGTSTQLNAAAPAWSPPIQERADVAMVDQIPPLQPAEATNASAPLVPDANPQKKAGKGKKNHQASAESPMVIIDPKAKSTDGVLKVSIEDQVRVPLVEFSDSPLEFNPTAVLALAWRENFIQVEDSQYHAGVRTRAIIRSSSLGNLSKTDWQSPTPGTQQAMQHVSAVDDSQNVVNVSVMQPANVLKNIVMEDKIPENVECTTAHVHEDAVGDGPLSTVQIDHERTYIDALRTSQSPVEVVVKDLSSSSSVNRRMISRPSRKGGVRISLPIPRVRSPSPPTSAAPTQFNLEAARSVAEQVSAENVLMPGFTFPLEESDDHDDVDSVDEDDERCRRRPGLRPRGVLRRNYSGDDFSLEF